SHTGKYPVGNTGLHQIYLQYTGLGPDPIQDCVAGIGNILPSGRADSIYDKTRFIVFDIGGIDITPFALPALCPQFLAQTPAVTGDQGVGSLENIGRGSITLFQP